MTERRADRRFIRTALERRYLDRDQAVRLLDAVRAHGSAPADQLAVELGVLSPRRVRRLQNHLLYRAMRQADKAYAALAAKSGLLPAAELQSAMREQRKRFEATRERTRLGSLLIEQGLLNDEQDRDLRLRVSHAPVSAASESAGEAVSDVGSELASELGGCGEPSSEEELFESDQVSAPSEEHLSAANAETRLVDDVTTPLESATEVGAPREAVAPAIQETTSERVSIPLDEPDPVVDELTERTTTRYRALDDAVTRVEAIRKVQHDLSSSGVFCAQDSAEMFERACRARACDRLTSPENSGSAPKTAAPSAAGKAVQEQEDLEAAQLLAELEGEVQPTERPTRGWKAAGLKALLGIDAA